MQTGMKVKEGGIQHALRIRISDHLYAGFPELRPRRAVLLAECFPSHQTAPACQPNGLRRGLGMIETRDHRRDRLEENWFSAACFENVSPGQARLIARNFQLLGWAARSGNPKGQA